MRLHLVVNPEGGLKKGISILKEVQPLFKKASIELNILKTEYSGHAEVYANTIEYLGYDGICAIGGDGTMSELINGMLKRKDGEKLPIGLIPGGTGNSLMHDLDCLEPKKAVKRIIQGKIKPIDIAKVDANGVSFFAFNIIGWGLATDAGRLAEKLRVFGGLRYNIASIIEVIRGKKRIAKLIIGNEVIEEDFVFIIACNTVYTGKAMKMAPNSKLDDGKIDLIIVRKSKKIKLLKLFPKLFTGEHVKSKLVEYRQVQKFSIIPDENSSLNIDGELIGITPVHVTMEPKRIHVLV